MNTTLEKMARFATWSLDRSTLEKPGDHRLRTSHHCVRSSDCVGVSAVPSRPNQARKTISGSTATMIMGL